MPGCNAFRVRSVHHGMSAYEWEPADNGERVQALWDLEDYYCGRFGECEKRRVDGSLCGLFRDARGRCGAESQHV